MIANFVSVSLQIVMKLKEGNMKATGVVRRIDELGRIVIPKEIRRTLKIREGTPLEIYSGDNGELLLKKYSPLIDITTVANEVAESIFSTVQKNVIVTNMESVVAASGPNKSNYINKAIDSQIERLINQRKTQVVLISEQNVLFFRDSETKSFVISPIIEGGDVYGSIIIFAANLALGECDKMIASSFSDFVGKQIG